MSKSLTFLIVMILTGFMFGVEAGAQDEGAKPGSILGGPAPLTIPDLEGIEPGEIEDFCDISLLPGEDWAFINNSDEAALDWSQPTGGVFPAHMGDPGCYIFANFNSSSGSGTTLSNWLITPELNLGQIESCSFFTRTVTGNPFPDRLEVRISTVGASTDVGGTALSVGDFTDLVIEINPNLQVGGYPQNWTEFVITPDVLGKIGGRIAFRYFVTDGGQLPGGINSNFIGIDTFSCKLKPIVATPIPTISEWGLVAMAGILGIVGFIVIRRRKVAA